MGAVTYVLVVSVVGCGLVSSGPLATQPAALKPLKTPVIALQEGQHIRQRRSRRGSFYRQSKGLERFLRTSAAPAEFGSMASFESTVIQCEFAGSPAPRIDWLLDGRIIQQADITEALEEQTNSLDAMIWAPSNAMVATRARLYLDCVTPRDQGIYTCQAQNGFQAESASTQLYIEDAISEKDMTACERAKDVSFRPARIVQWRTRILAPIGGRARLVCETTGLPSPQVTWRKGERLITGDDPRVTGMSNGDLILDPLKWSDMGLYSCTANNELSNDQVDTFLYPYKA